MATLAQKGFQLTKPEITTSTLARKPDEDLEDFEDAIEASEANGIGGEVIENSAEPKRRGRKKGSKNKAPAQVAAPVPGSKVPSLEELYPTGDWHEEEKLAFVGRVFLTAASLAVPPEVYIQTLRAVVQAWETVTAQD